MLLNFGGLLLKRERNSRKEVFPMANKRRFVLGLWMFNKTLALSVLGLLSVDLAVSRQAGGQQQVTIEAIQNAYAKHDINVRNSLPAYSGPPLLLDLFQKSLQDGLCDPQQHTAW
ncbi:MAG TPA: hypothetical protein VFR08_00770, partial [Candidatus Angelobacter sp.]|nr:hypothetical protein [Candidatus Angelobacter sp.]